MNANMPFDALPSWVVVIIVIVGVVQLSVEVFALYRLARTPVERVVFGKKWPWILIILLVNLVGAIVFLAAGQRPAQAMDPSAVNGTPDPSSGQRANHVVDLLYGEDEKR